MKNLKEYIFESLLDDEDVLIDKDPKIFQVYHIINVDCDAPSKKTKQDIELTTLAKEEVRNIEFDVCSDRVFKRWYTQTMLNELYFQSNKIDFLNLFMNAPISILSNDYALNDWAEKYIKINKNTNFHIIRLNKGFILCWYIDKKLHQGYHITLIT